MRLIVLFLALTAVSVIACAEPAPTTSTGSGGGEGVSGSGSGHGSGSGSGSGTTSSGGGASGQGGAGGSEGEGKGGSGGEGAGGSAGQGGAGGQGGGAAVCNVPSDGTCTGGHDMVIQSSFTICNGTSTVGQKASASGVTCSEVCCVLGFSGCMYRAAQADYNACMPQNPMQSGSCADVFQPAWSSQCVCCP